MNQYGRIVLFGASSGIGLEVSKYLSDKCEELITASRRESGIGRWIKTDVSDAASIQALVGEIGDKTIDGILYLGGTWEEKAFTEGYSFEECADNDLENVLNVNLLAPIRLVQRLLPNLRRSENAKIIVIGAAFGGLTGYAGKEVSNTASKYGLKGMVMALRKSLSNDRIGVTLINPGNVATPEVLGDLQQEGLDESHAIPISDILSSIDYVLQLSNRTNINEIEMPTM